MSPTITTSKLSNTVEVIFEMSLAANSFNPSALNISTGYLLNGFDAELITKIGPPGPSFGSGGGGLAVVKFHV
jgi:hypothetical protein